MQEIVEILPIECIVRREHPVEYHLKCEAFHDPIIEYNEQTQRVFVFSSNTSATERSLIDEISLQGLGVTPQDLDRMQELTRHIFGFFAGPIGLKITFGKDDGGEIKVMKVIKDSL